MFAPLTRRLEWGIKAGLGMATVLVLWALGVFVFAGSGPFRARGITFAAAVAVYFVGGIAGGALVGVMLPLVRWPVGAACVGMVATLPVALVAALAITGTAPWTVVETVSVALFVFFFGGPIGITYRHIYIDEIRDAERWLRRRGGKPRMQEE